MVYIKLSITEKQRLFIDSVANETLFGGAAGGGKSFAQLIDGLLFALKYAGSKQLMLRRTFPELKRSLILASLILFPHEVGKYNGSEYRWRFFNGSSIEFGYCDTDADVRKYQSAEYDVIRFDELTHFSEWQYRYLISRVRGANSFPKAVKSTTNPGGVGHSWVKERFIDAAPALEVYTDEFLQTRVFIPALVQDNKFLMESDPNYVDRLRQLDENSKRALLYGEWDLFEGKYFSEFSHSVHVISSFEIPSDWKRYLCIDYGLDMLAALWVAVDNNGAAYVYREVYQSGLIISEAAKAILAAEQGERIYERLAPPDLFSRRQETGKSAIDIFLEQGLYFVRSSNERVPGWFSLKEWLKPKSERQGETQFVTAKLRIFNCCRNLIRTLPGLQIDGKNPNDVASEPHELTHLADALRGFAVTYKQAVVPVRFGGEFDGFLGFGA